MEKTTEEKGLTQVQLENDRQYGSGAECNQQLCNGCTPLVRRKPADV